MKTSVALLSAAVAGLLVYPSAHADEPRATAKIGGPFEVAVTRDIAYYEGKDADPDKNKLDLYLPKGQKDFPVLLFVHGGAWKQGDRKMYSALGNMFARNGIGAVTVSYRLSPKFKHPAHIEDVARAFAWTHGNIARHGGRPDQIFICGHSAGAHLVALLATNVDYLKQEKLSPANIKGVIPISGVFEITPGRLADVFGTDPDVLRQASPIRNLTGKQPPFLLIYAEKDYAKFDEYARTMEQALKKQGTEASSVMVKDRTHITIIINATYTEDPAAQAILAFVAKHSNLKLTSKGS
jgi:acetyl esterase/lipase